MERSAVQPYGRRIEFRVGVNRSNVSHFADESTACSDPDYSKG